MSAPTKGVIPYKPYNIVAMDFKALRSINDSTPIDSAQSAMLAAILQGCKFEQMDSDLRTNTGNDVNNGIRQYFTGYFTTAEKPDKSVFRFVRAILIRNPELHISFMVAEVNQQGEVLEASRLSGRISKVSNPASGHPDDTERLVQIEITGHQDFAPELEKLAASLMVKESIQWKKA